MKRKVIIWSLMAALLLGGCGVEWPDMTEEQAEQIGEYAAISLLKYDANSRSRLVDLSQIENVESGMSVEEPEPTPAPEQEEEPTFPDTPVIEIGEETSGAENAQADSLESFLGLGEGLTIVYVGEELCQSYDGDLSVDASAGKSLLVLKFQINNILGADQTVNLLDRRDVYRITVNENYTRAALTTMLLDDLSTYVNTIPAGESATAVLLFEIDQSQADALTSISLSLKNDVQTYALQIL